MSECVTTLADRDRWMKAILASEEIDNVQRVALRLALYLNLKTGRCDPSYDGLARNLGLAPRHHNRPPRSNTITARTVMRAVERLEAKGWIAVERAVGRGRTNRFALLLEKVTPESHLFDDEKGDTWVSPLIAEKVTPGCHPFDSEKGDNSPPEKVTNFREKVTTHSLKGDTQVSPEQREQKEQRKRTESSAVPADDEIDPADFCSEEGEDTEAATAFEAWWRQYPLKVAKDDARKAWNRIIAAGKATAAELQAGAMRYAAARAGQDQKFTKHPATWLTKGCWLDEPAPAAVADAPVIDEHGNEIAPSPPRRDWRANPPTSYREIAQMRVEQAEDAQ